LICSFLVLGTVFVFFFEVLSSKLTIDVKKIDEIIRGSPLVGALLVVCL
jgi:hypothetical protein